MCNQQSLRSACAYMRSDQSLCWSLEYSMIVKLLTEHHLEFLSLKGGCRGSSESTLVKLLEISCHCSNVINFVTSCICRKQQTDKWKYKNKAHVNRFTTVEQEAQKRKDIKHTKKQVRSWKWASNHRSK